MVLSESTTPSPREKVVKVLDKHGTHISMCTMKRAYQLLGRESADWVGYRMLQLRYNRYDRKLFRQIAMERDNYTCYICGLVMDKEDPRATADHILAKAEGGTDLPENLACCCYDCNEQKGNMGLGKFLQLKLRGAIAPVAESM